MPFDAFVFLHDLLGVDGQLLVRVDHHAEQPRVCLKRKRKKRKQIYYYELERFASDGDGGGWRWRPECDE